MSNLIELIEPSSKRIRPYIKHTPLIYDDIENLFLKCENRQVTGSFKVRGAVNKVLTLGPEELAHDLVTASAGNHGQGVAFASHLVGATATIFCSENAVPSKVQAMEALGAGVKFVKGGYALAETTAKNYALQNQACWISPYNDLHVIAGQSTLAMEIMNELPELSDPVWCVPVGGGGLISGIGAYLRSINSKSRIIGVQSESSPFFHSIFHYNTQNGVNDKPTLADGLSGAVDTESITIPLVKRLVDDFILVNEDEIRAAIKYAWVQYNEIVEGSAAVALAAVITRKISTRPVVIVLSGGNIQPEIHNDIVTMENNLVKSKYRSNGT
jgi:threonine dehydratase